MLAAGVAVSSRPQPLLSAGPSRSPLSPHRPRRAERHVSVLLAKASAKPPTPSEDSDDSSSDVVASSSSSASSAPSSPAPPPPPTRAVRPLNPSSRAAAASEAASSAAAPPPPPLRARLPTTLPALPFPASEVLSPGQEKRLHLFEARYLALLDEALARGDGCLAHVVAEPASSLRNSPNYYDVTEEYTRFRSPDSGSGSSLPPNSLPPPPLVVGSYVLRLATLARVVDVRRPPASSRAPGALVTIRGEARLALLSLEDDSPYLRVQVEAAPDSVPTAEAVRGGGDGGERRPSADVEARGDEGGAEQEEGEAQEEQEEALVAAALARRAQEVEALLWDVVNLSYKLPRPREPQRRRGRRSDELRIRGFDDGGEEEEEEEEAAPLSPDPAGTIAALQSALNWAGDVPGLAPLSLSSSPLASSSSSSSASASSPSSPSASSSPSSAAASPSSSPSSSSSLSPLAAAAERGARLGFAALQQVPHAGSPESLRSLAEARAAAMETGDTAERLRLAADFLRKARAELAAKAALKALQLG